MYSLRKLESSDYNKGYLELLETLTTVNVELITSEKFDSFIKSLNENHVVYVLENMETIIGSGTILIENKIIHNCGKVGHIEDIVIHPSYKGKQLGKLIVDSLVEYAQHKGCYKVILDCDDSLQPFYEKCSFKRKGCQMSLYF